MQARLKNYWRGKLSDHVAASSMDESTVSTSTSDVLFSHPNINPSMLPDSGSLSACPPFSTSLLLSCFVLHWSSGAAGDNGDGGIHRSWSTSRQVLVDLFSSLEQMDSTRGNPRTKNAAVLVLSPVIPFDSFFLSFFLCCLTSSREPETCAHVASWSRYFPCNVARMQLIFL